MSYAIHQVTHNSAYSRYFTKTRYAEGINGTIPIKVTYGVVSSYNPIVQFGYNCEPKGMALQYPIYIDWPSNAAGTDVPYDDDGEGTSSDEDQRIFIGKNGIYEAEYGEHLAIYKFAVPLNIKFTCNYVTSNTDITNTI